MKKIKTLLVLLALFFMGYNVNNVNAKEKVNVYLFYGDGCPYCESAMEYFDGMDDEYKDKMELVKYEVWNDQDNAALLESVGTELGEEISGVPFIVIGDKTFAGYREEFNKDIEKAIDKFYEEDNAYDVMDNVSLTGNNNNNNKTNNKTDTSDVIVYFSMAIIAAGVIGLIFYAKKSVN